jgi:hypothetical protein
MMDEREMVRDLLSCCSKTPQRWWWVGVVGSGGRLAGGQLASLVSPDWDGIGLEWNDNYLIK